MQNFKVGDWVRIKTDTFEYDGTASISKGVKQLSKSNMWIFSENHYKCDPDKYIEHWKPTEGEWCWYSKWDKVVCVEFYLCKFVLDMNEVEPEFKHKYEPFIGQLPSFLKDNT